MGQEPVWLLCTQSAAEERGDCHGNEILLLTVKRRTDFLEHNTKHYKQTSFRSFRGFSAQGIDADMNHIPPPQVVLNVLISSIEHLQVFLFPKEDVGLQQVLIEGI